MANDIFYVISINIDSEKKMFNTNALQQPVVRRCERSETTDLLVNSLSIVIYCTPYYNLPVLYILSKRK